VPSETPQEFVRRVTRRIAELRREKGLTQDQFAEVLGTATRNIRRIEAGQNLTLFTLARIAAAIGVQPDDLLVSDVPGRRGSSRPASALPSPTQAAAEKTKRPSPRRR